MAAPQRTRAARRPGAGASRPTAWCRATWCCSRRATLVPADLRLHEVAQLRVDESALTGESVSVEKHAAALALPAKATCRSATASTWRFKGTLVTHGRATGPGGGHRRATELGRIATLLEQSPDRATPLQQRLAAFGKRLSLVVLAICALIFAIGVLRGEPRAADGADRDQPGGGRDPRGAAGGGDGAAGARRAPAGAASTRWCAGCRPSRRWAR